MGFGIQLVFCVSVLLTGASQTRGKSRDLPPAFSPPGLLSPTGASASPDLAEDPGNEALKPTHNPGGGSETSYDTSAVTQTESSVRPAETVTNAALQTHMLTSTPAAPTSQQTTRPFMPTPHLTAASPSDILSSTPTAPSTASPQDASTTEGRTPLTSESVTSFSSPPAHVGKDSTSTSTSTSTAQPQSESLTSVPGRAPAGPTHQETPSELNVGDEGLKKPHYRSSSPLDPLLAGLLSVFIVTTAVVFVVLFLKFRQRTNHPEFHRLQDLPMDDLMEDTPLSRYSY